MSRAFFFLVFVCALTATAACGGRSGIRTDLTAAGAGGQGGLGPAGVGGANNASSNAATGTASGTSNAVTGSAVTGTATSSAASGSTVSSTSSGPGPSAASGVTTGGGPIGCFQCIGQECPEALGCVQDPTCIQGVICAFSQCLGGGGGGGIDFSCLLQCFNGDFGAAFEAFQSVSCILQQCQDDCGDLIGG